MIIVRLIMMMIMVIVLVSSRTGNSSDDNGDDHNDRGGDSADPGKFPMDLEIPPLSIKIMLESNPLKSTMLVGRLGVSYIMNTCFGKGANGVGADRYDIV